MIFRKEIESGDAPRLRWRDAPYPFLALGLSLFWGLAAAEAHAQDGHTVQLLPLAPGTSFGSAAGINDKGQIVGQVQANVPQPAFWAGPNAAAPSLLPVSPSAPGPFVPGGSALSINKRGQVVGQVTDQFFRSLPAFWQGPDSTAPVVLPVPPGILFGSASGINDKGQIVGRVFDQFGESLPLFWEGPDATAPTVLPVLPNSPGPFPGGFAASLNDNGEIVGWVSDGFRQRPAFWAGPNVTAPTILPEASGGPALVGEATGINRNGQIVGTVGIGAVLWDGPDATTATVLSVPPGFGGQPSSINENGQIVGQFPSAFGPQPALWAGPDATATVLPVPPGAPFAFAASINKKGLIVGQVGFFPALWASDNSQEQ